MHPPLETRAFWPVFYKTNPAHASRLVHLGGVSDPPLMALEPIVLPRVEVVWAEVARGPLGTQHLGDDNEQRVADRHNGLVLPTASGEAVIWCGKTPAGRGRGRLPADRLPLEQVPGLAMPPCGSGAHIHSPQGRTVAAVKLSA
jgi:hypothetical protein